MSIRALASPAAVRARLARRDEPQVRLLNAFAAQIAADTGHWTPAFDPDSGGVGAKVLLLLESPGPKVSVTSFISQDDPDQTAEKSRTSPC